MKKRIFSVIFVSLMLCALTVTVFSAPVIDLSRTGSISITMTYNGDSVPGGTLTLYQVADVQMNDADCSFAFTEKFAECGIELNDITDPEVAESLAAFIAETALQGTTLEINEEGQIVFEDLKLGLYLLIQQNSADGFSNVNPFLVSVPRLQNEEYQYDVNASPKIALEPVKPSESTEPSEPTEPTEPNLPQTGQLKWPIPVLSIGGVLLIVLGIILCGNHVKKEHEE